jgi:hypothetical protein
MTLTAAAPEVDAADVVAAIASLSEMKNVVFDLLLLSNCLYNTVCCSALRHKYESVIEYW